MDPGHDLRNGDCQCAQGSNVQRHGGLQRGIHADCYRRAQMSSMSGCSGTRHHRPHAVRILASDGWHRNVPSGMPSVRGEIGLSATWSRVVCRQHQVQRCELRRKATEVRRCQSMRWPRPRLTAMKEPLSANHEDAMQGAKDKEAEYDHE